MRPKDRISLIGLVSSFVVALGTLMCGGCQAMAPGKGRAGEPQPLTITTTSLPNGTVGVQYSFTLQSSGGVAPISWSLGTDAGLPPGLSLSSAGIISGTPTAPACQGVELVAADSSTPPQQSSGSLTLGVNAEDASHDGLWRGHYAFLISGLGHSPDTGTALFAYAGSFVSDGEGNLTGGVYDFNGPTGLATSQRFTGSYALGNDDRGTMCMLGETTLAFSVGSLSSSGVATKGRMIDKGFQTGELELQDTTAFSTSAVSGPYAFGLSALRVSGDGVFTADDSGNIPNGNVDGTSASNESFVGSYSVPSGSTTGRGTASWTKAGATLNMAFYIVSAGKLFMVSADQNTSGVYIGYALKQLGAPFDNSSLKGTSVFAITGFASCCGVVVTAGLDIFDGAGTVTVLQDQNSGGTVTLADTMNQTYSVASNGRVVVESGGTALSVFYLVSPGRGFIFNMDSRSGFFEPQAAGPFTDSSINGRFFFGNLQPPWGNLGTLVSGVVTANGGIIDQTSDIGDRGSLAYGQTSNDTYTMAPNGRATTGSSNEVIYVVSPTKFLTINANPSSNFPAVAVAEQ